MIVKKETYGFALYFKALDAAGTPYISLENARFTYSLELKGSPSFGNYTLLDAGAKKYKAGHILYFTNNPVNTEVINHSLIDALKPALFTYTFPFKAAAPGTDTGLLAVSDAGGNPVPISAGPIQPDKAGVYTVSADFRSLPKGLYTFNVSDNTHAAENYKIYIDSGLAGKSVLGILDINYSPGMRSAYALNFKRRETHWKYVIVNKSRKLDLSSVTLSVTDESDDTGNPYGKYVFKKQPGQQSFNGMEAVFFRSETVIPWFEVPKLKLELSKNPDPNPAIIKNLPNPSAAGAAGAGNDSEIYVFV